MVWLKTTNSVFCLTASKTASKNEGRKTEGKNEGLLRFYQKNEGFMFMFYVLCLYLQNIESMPFNIFTHLIFKL